jgi:hypothetical protein
MMSTMSGMLTLSSTGEHSVVMRKVITGSSSSRLRTQNANSVDTFSRRFPA